MRGFSSNIYFEKDYSENKKLVIRTVIPHRSDSPVILYPILCDFLRSVCFARLHRAEKCVMGYFLRFGKDCAIFRHLYFRSEGHGEIKRVVEIKTFI